MVVVFHSYIIYLFIHLFLVPIYCPDFHYFSDLFKLCGCVCLHSFSQYQISEVSYLVFQTKNTYLPHPCPWEEKKHTTNQSRTPTNLPFIIFKLIFKLLSTSFLMWKMKMNLSKSLGSACLLICVSHFWISNMCWSEIQSLNQHLNF